MLSMKIKKSLVRNSCNNFRKTVSEPFCGYRDVHGIADVKIYKKKAKMKSTYLYGKIG